VRRDRFFPGIETEAAVGPGEELAEFPFADELFPTKQGEETVPEKFGERFDRVGGKDVEAPLAVHESGGREDVEMRMEVQVVAEGLHGGDGGDASIRQPESSPHPVLEAVDGRAEEMIEELASFAEDPAEGFGHREHELPVRHVEAKNTGNPITGRADFALMATRTEVPRLAGEGEEALVPAVRTLEPRETGGEVATAMELADDIDGLVAERAVDRAVAVFVARLEVGPEMMDELPEGRGSGTARAIDGGH